MDTQAQPDFYAQLPAHASFETLADGAHYQSVPDDWFVGVADIVGSTGHVARGLYKTVNTVGAAVISAQVNTAGGERFPYVFGGDGASFAFPSRHRERVRETLARTIRWAREEFGFELRGAIVPVADIRAAGMDVAVARYAASSHVDYAMFSGGGVAWAEAQMKAGHYLIEPAPPGAHPDLSGLSCRWTPMRSNNGKILSLIAIPQPGAKPDEVARVMRRIVDATRRLERGGHPVPPTGPGTGWPAQGMAIEAHASRRGGSLWLRKIALAAETLFSFVVMRMRLRLGSFDASHYMQAVTDNADFRKYDDGLKMTIDIDATARTELESVLAEGEEAGVISYGLFEQDEAIMTCIVPSVTSDDHVHFVDGASGGYTTAAMSIRKRPRLG
jgi:hypothetical protein